MSILSPGRWHESVPRTLRANCIYRKKILDAARYDRDVQRRLRVRCKDDALFFINTFVYQFNPSFRGIAAVHPFITFPVQERVLNARPETHKMYRPFDRGVFWCIENDKTMACEKSRWQGASWLFLIAQDWHCTFHEFVQTLNISRNEDAVDDGTKDSLFWKVRYMHERLPVWLTGEIEDSKLYFHYHLTDSEMTGQASTAKSGVGGRATEIFVDEYPETPAAQELREKTALTANSRFFNGTHKGVGTPFEVMCDEKKSPEIIRQRMHWTDNPQQNPGLYEYDPLTPGKPKILDKEFVFPKGYKFVLDGTPAGGHRPGVRSPWYDRKCVEIGDSRAIAQNLDIDVQGSAKQFFDALKIRNLVERCSPPLWVGDVDYDPAGRFRRIVEDPEGRLRLWVRPVHDGQRLPKSTYCIGNDIAAGTGATPSCMAIIDAHRGMKIGEYVDPFIEEKPFAQLVTAVAGWLEARVVWDAGGQQGVKFETEFLRLGYLNYYHDKDDTSHINFAKPSKRPGFYGSDAAEYRTVKDYRDAIYCGDLVDLSADCLGETLLFEWDDKTGKVQHSGKKRTNDPSGARENHGDRVTAAKLAWMIAKEYASGGRKSIDRPIGPEPGSMEWLLMLETRDEEALVPYD